MNYMKESIMPTRDKMKKLSQINTAHILEIGVRWIIGIIFIWASIDKIVHPQEFARIIFNYQILPDELINITAITLPWLELIAGIFLITGIWMRGAAIICVGLLTIFSGLLVFNIFRGMDVACGCFSTSVEYASSGSKYWYVARDLLFLIPAAYLFYSVFMKKNSKSE